MNTQRITCNRFDISNRKGTVKKTRTSHGKAIVETSEIISHAADAFETREDINKFVGHMISKKSWSMAVLFIVGINTGFRCGDMLAFKVSDFDLAKKPDSVNIIEQKTGKVRVVYLNEAVYKAIEMLISKKNLNSDDYLFTSDTNRKSYFVDFVRNDEGEIIDIITTNDKCDSYGNERKVAPLTVDSIGRAYKRFSKELNLSGHYSSHCARKTFSFFISNHEYKNTRNVTAASMALNHSSEAITETYYTKGVDAKELKEVWMNMNLGIESITHHLIPNGI